MSLEIPEDIGWGPSRAGSVGTCRDSGVVLRQEDIRDARLLIFQLSAPGAGWTGDRVVQVMGAGRLHTSMEVVR